MEDIQSLDNANGMQVNYTLIPNSVVFRLLVLAMALVILASMRLQIFIIVARIAMKILSWKTTRLDSRLLAVV